MIAAKEARSMMEREGGISTLVALFFTKENMKSPSIQELALRIVGNTFVFALDEWPASSAKRVKQKILDSS